MKDMLVAGLGNVLLGDEGIGPRTIHELQQQGVPHQVKLVDVGIAPFALLHLLPAYGRVLIVDAIRAGGAPGTIYHFPLKPSVHELQQPLTIHHLGLLQLLCHPRSGLRQPAIEIAGMEPERIQWGDDLSETVKAELPQLVRLILREIERTYSPNREDTHESENQFGVKEICSDQRNRSPQGG